MKLEADVLRWYCPSEWLEFSTTADLPPSHRIEGQPDAVESLSYGLSVSCDQHVFARGASGVGRLSLVLEMVRNVDAFCAPVGDKCYVHNFDNPASPVLLELPRGTSDQFKSLIDRFIRFVRDGLAGYLESDVVTSRRTRIEHATQRAMKTVGEPFEAELRERGLALVPVQSGGAMAPAILPVIEGRAVSLQEFTELQRSGSVSAEQSSRIIQAIEESAEKLQSVSKDVQEIQEKHREQIHTLFEEEARRTVHHRLQAIANVFDQDKVKTFLSGVEDDLVGTRLGELDEPAFTRLYEVNVISHPSVDGQPPVIVERFPNVRNLFGFIDRSMAPNGASVSDHMMIHGGSLIAADGGFLILDAQDLLLEPGAWQHLTRALRSHSLDLSFQEADPFFRPRTLTPERVPLQVKVVLVGDHQIHYMLDTNDPYFGDLFKVLADFDDSLERTRANVAVYAGIVGKIVHDHDFLPVARAGVAALIEHGVRIASQRDRVTLRFGRVTDILREANWLARQRNAESVDREDVVQAIRAGRRRADLPVRRFRRMIKSGDIRIEVSGEVVGQINGLAISRTGPLTYGFPARITATVSAGSRGAINIEGEANLSGSIHTKGFQILEGLLRHLLRVNHPLGFTASVAFEQSYGGIDGDSASCAEICALLSALTGVPLRQDLAITGAIDQKGHVLPIGGVSEKVEGFYYACSDLGMTGTQGVLIPAANCGDLALNEEVVEAARAGRFAVHSITTVHEALALLTGLPVVERGPTGYPADTFLALAERKVTEYWKLIAPTPG